MTYLAIPKELGAQLQRTLMSSAPLESGAFCRLHHVVRGDAVRYVLGPPINSSEPWVAQQRDLITPSGRRISAAISAANADRCGLAFVHSHPSAQGAWLSALDRETSARLGQGVGDMLDGAFASLVVTPADWAGVTVESTELVPFDRVALVGRELQLRQIPAAGFDRELDDRQIRAMGEEAQALLRSLRVAVVGAGGVGSPLAETLARMGVGEIRLIDSDTLDTVSNARRVFGVTRADAAAEPARFKAEVVGGYLDHLGLGATVVPIVGDVRSSGVQARLLDVDVVLAGTDTHSSRAALTELSVRAALPLIDVGVRVGLRRDGRQLDALRLERRIQVPGGPCLWCWGSLSAEEVQAELLPDDQRRALVRDGYIAGLPGAPAPSVASLTVMAAGAAASALLAIISGALDAAPLGMGIDAITLESAPLRRQAPDPDCVCARWRARTE
jgi:molybdopterin-synthase adenylyltransferase